MSVSDLPGLNISLSNGDFLSSRLTSYQTAVSGDATPTAAPTAQGGPWEGQYHRSSSIASSSQVSSPQCLANDHNVHRPTI